MSLLIEYPLDLRNIGIKDYSSTNFEKVRGFYNICSVKKSIP